MDLSFTEEYFPSLGELTAEQNADARAKTVASLQPAMPDISLVPGTPTGDCVVTIAGACRAAIDEATSRFMSDLNLDNVANGVIYSCNFVRAFLGNFAVYDVENLKAFGIVRLTFTSPEAREISRTVRFRFGTADDWSIKVAEPSSSVIDVLPAGSEHNGEPDTYILAQTSANTWAVDLPVEGILSAPIAAGTSGTATEVSADLVGLTSAIRFTSGIPSATLSDLARMARKVSASLTSGSRAATKSLIYRNWPETTMASPIVPGDVEMQRVAAGSALALVRPSVDIYFRSSSDMRRITQNIRLDYVEIPGGARRFRGALQPLHRPSRIVSAEWSGSTSESLIEGRTVYSKTGRADLYGSLHCGTRYETLYIELDPVIDNLDLPLIPLSEDGGGAQYAIFTIVYDCDPLLETVSSLLESPEHRPPGVDVLVKSGPMLLVDDLTITYTKKHGTKTALSVARDKIVEYLRTAGHPEDFRVTVLHDIVRNAGAGGIVSVTSHGRIFVSAADRLFRSSVTDPMDVTNWINNSDFFHVPTLSNLTAVANPNTIISGEISAGGPPDAWAATRRTVRYVTDPQNVKFVEIS